VKPGKKSKWSAACVASRPSGSEAAAPATGDAEAAAVEAVVLLPSADAQHKFLTYRPGATKNIYTPLSLRGI
jgi:hypothetical protein